LNLQESIEIINIYNSTAGKALHYKDHEGKCYYYYYRDKTRIESVQK
jgi:hypothetical protein